MSAAVNPLLPFRPLGTIPQEAIDDLPKVIGPHTPLFANAYDFQQGRILNTWNWFAFLVPYFWCWYRKMPQVAVLVLALEIMLGWILPTMGASQAAVLVGLVGLRIFYGLVGVGYYVAHSLIQVRAIQANTKNVADRQLAYSHAGGTSLPMVALGFVVYMMASLVLAHLEERGYLTPLLAPHLAEAPPSVPASG